MGARPFSLAACLLPEVLDVVLRGNPDILAARLRADSAHGEQRSARAIPNPVVNSARFTDDGTVEQVRIKASQGARAIPWGPFRVYADTGRTQLLCFSFRRSRALPACRYSRSIR